MAAEHRDVTARDSAEDAPARILAAAEEVFAAEGFKGGTLRQVALVAKVPLGLIAYHFGDKLGLYREIFVARTPELVQQRIAGLALADLESDPRRRLELVVKASLVPMLRLRCSPQGRLFGVLLAREVSDPAFIERRIVGDLLDPVSRAFMTRLRETLPDISEARAMWSYGAMIGAVLYFVGGAGRMKNFSGGIVDPDDVSATAEHLIAFVLAGLGFQPDP